MIAAAMTSPIRTGSGTEEKTSRSRATHGDPQWWPASMGEEWSRGAWLLGLTPSPSKVRAAIGHLKMAGFPASIGSGSRTDAVSKEWSGERSARERRARRSAVGRAARSVEPLRSDGQVPPALRTGRGQAAGTPSMPRAGIACPDWRWYRLPGP